WLTANLDGSISEVEDPEQDDANIPGALAIARRTPGLQILAMVSDQGGDAEQSNGIRAFAQLSNPMYRARLMREIMALTRKYGFDGIVLNFENPIGVEETDFQTFLTELAAQLKPDKKIAVLVPGDWQIDYKALAARSDLVIVELFNEGLTGPSALAPKAWSEEVVGLRTSDIPAEKLVFAVASFGRDWTDGAGSEPVAFSSLMLNATSQGAAISFDETTANPRLTYSDQNGFAHEVWFLDAVTLFNQFRQFARFSPKGVALWELGSED